MNDAWSTGPATPRLHGDDVHVWSANLNAPATATGDDRQVLAPAELERATRFRFDIDRRRYIATHTILRRLLGRYLAIHPSAVRITTDTQGKPQLDHSLAHFSVSFNISHSHDLALFAITRRRRIGVDVERTREEIAVEEIAAHSLAPAERAILRSLPRERRVEAFFICWTRKEAYLKARGCGLLLPPDQVAVSLAPNAPPAILWAADDPDAPNRWTVVQLTPISGYTAAAVIEGRDLTVQSLRWTT